MSSVPKTRPPVLSFPDQLDHVRDVMRGQTERLHEVASLFAEAIAAGGLVHVYANGHSRLAVEELCVRMGALTGFHALLQTGLTTFTDVVGVNGIRVNQAIEKFEGLGARLLDDYDIGPGEPLLVITATGTTPAAVDIAREWVARYPDNPIVGLCSAAQSARATPKHSSGENLSHVIARARRGVLIDNGMPIGDTTVLVEGRTGAYPICPLSSVAALTAIQCLNELTLRELDARGVAHHVLRNMHLGDTHDSYERWIRDQRARYARALHRPTHVGPSP
ncbi:MAG: sugar isomerase domain-containing protein [Opitutae bacterium]|jgi:uncharacterized phosphosugar-binding protein|nr:sugar isomerase domain-containing protein [Opitutae bacterium]